MGKSLLNMVENTIIFFFCQKGCSLYCWEWKAERRERVISSHHSMQEQESCWQLVPRECECEETVLWSLNCSLVVHALLRGGEMALRPCPPFWDSFCTSSLMYLWPYHIAFSHCCILACDSSSGGILGWFKGIFYPKILYCFLGACVLYPTSLYCDQAC